jgi:hypothetical protein
VPPDTTQHVDKLTLEGAPIPQIWVSPRSGHLEQRQPWIYGSDSFRPVTNKFCSGSPDQCRADSNVSGGTESVYQIIVGDNADVWGFAGLGIWWLPQGQNVVSVEFRALVYWRYLYELASSWDTAHSSGDIGLRIFSWDAQGQDMQTIDHREPLWAYGVDFWDPHQKAEDEGHTNLYLTFHPEQGRSYLCTSYVSAASDANGYPLSQAVTSLSAHQGWLVTQDWVFVP